MKPIVIVAAVGIILFAVQFEKLAPAPAVNLLVPPAFSEPSGVYDYNFSLSLDAPPVADAHIIYTTNGRFPTPDSALTYNAPIPLNSAAPNVTTIRARTLLPDGSLSEEVVGTYAMGIKTQLPLVSLLAEPDDLWSSERGIFANRIMRGAEWERPGNITYLDENGRFGFNEAVGLRLHGQGSSFTDKKSLRLYFRREYGVGRLNYPLFPENNVPSYDRLVLHNGGQDNALFAANWTLMRTQLMAKLAQDMETYTTNNLPVLLFLNGELYGIYHLRERVDETFFQDHYDIDAAQILNSPHLDSDQPPQIADWWALEEYAAEHDLADPEHYAYILSQIDVDNMIDHYILQMYAVNTDCPHKNDIIFRGSDPLARWRWFLWDLDYSFGLQPVSSLDFVMATWVMDPEHTHVEAATILIRNLWDNPEFRNRFLVRTADLLNTTLAPENVTKQLADVEGARENDIGYEVARWGSSGNWYASVQQMHTFAQQRPDRMRQYFVDGFGLPGTAVLTLNPPAAGKGTIILNDTLSPTLPYTGDYFLDTTIAITAVPDSGYQLTGWELNGEIVDGETAVLHHTLTQDTNITPHFARQ